VGKHARLGPSNHRWPNCPGSVREEANYPDTTNNAAVDGTGSHLLLEHCVVNEQAVDSFINTLIGQNHEDRPTGWLIDKKRADRVKVCLDYIDLRNKELGGVVVESESISNPGEFMGRDDWWGTTDITLTTVNQSVIEVIDYKDGFVWVDAKNNPQLEAYGLGKLLPLIDHLVMGNNFDHEQSPVKIIRLTIVQPKTSKPVRYVEYSPAQLWQRGLKLKDAASKTDQAGALLCSGDWCRWCKHADCCDELNSKKMEGFAMLDNKSGTDSLTNIDITSIADMPAEDLAKILDAKESLKKAMKVIETAEVESLKRLEAGQPIPRYTIGSGNNSQAWKEDEKLTVKKLKGMRFTQKDLYPTKLLSPAQALKKEDLTPRQRDRMIAELIDVKDGKPKVVPMKTNTMSAEEMFAEIDIPDATLIEIVTTVATDAKCTIDVGVAPNTNDNFL